MSKSRFIEAERLKPLIAYLAVAFIVMLALGTAVPVGPSRTLLIVAWLILLPMGAWRILKKPAE
ncbi:MAG: hypothetical protein P8L45_02180 [Longimicrobiales bacterium]|nr:hypothetical protein [Longimicrobiales bacterium]